MIPFSCYDTNLQLKGFLIIQEIINQSSISFAFLNVNNVFKIRIITGILDIDIIRKSQNQVFQKILSNYSEFIKKVQNENI
jgi:hypothetical protein